MNFISKIKKTAPILLLFLIPIFSSAYEIKDTNSEIKGDFVLEPAKVEVFLDAGETKTKMLNVLNRTDKTLEYQIEIEDFSGSHDPNQTVILSGEEKGPYSLKDYLIPEIDSFTLKPGQKIIFPVEINIPADAEPGGLYGSVLISSKAVIQGKSGTTVISRLGALFFVNVNGKVTKSGKLISFDKAEKEEGADGIDFEFLFENTGNTHLNPYGTIKVFNLVGTQVGDIEVEAYFAMPDSVRYRKVHWDSGRLFGRYKAFAEINRGYDDKFDEMVVTFWVVSTKIVITVVGVLILLLLLIIWLVRTFDFNITKEGNVNDSGSRENDNSLNSSEAEIETQLDSGGSV